MTSRIEYKGEWKLPDDENWINGTLVFDPDLGSKLELFGTFNPFIFDRESKEIILGKTTEGDVTLIDNWYRGKKQIHNGVTIGTYKPIIIIQGYHFNKLSSIKFSQVTFRTFNLFQYFNLTGQIFDIKNQAKSYEIKYDEITPIDFSLNNNCNGQITFDGPLTIGGRYNEMELKEEAYVSLNYNSEEEYQQIFEDISKIVDLVTLLSFEQSYPTFITFRDSKFTEDVNGIIQNKNIYCFYEHGNYNKNHKLRNRGQHLVGYENISEKFPAIIENWFKLYEDTEEVIRLILKYFKTKYKFSSDKFVDVVRALESYHRIHINNERLPKEKFNDLVSTILSQIELDKDDSTWLEQRLMGNEPNLKIRIEELISNNKTVFISTKIEKLNKFCRQTTDSRNYYTHYDPKKKNRALKGRELSDLTRINRAIVISCLLNHIGIESEFYEEGLNYNLG